MNKKRTQQISEEVRKCLAEIVQNKLKDPRIPTLLSISSVEVTNDLSFAKVYVSVLGSEKEKEEAIKGLNSAKGFLKKELGRSVKLRAMPELIFTGDDSIERGVRMSKLIDEVNNGNN